LAGDDLLLHLLGQRILEREVIPAVDEELVLQMLWRVEILAGRLLPVTPALNTVVARSDPPILDLHIGGRVSKFALGIRARAFLTLELAADFELEPP